LNGNSRSTDDHEGSVQWHEAACGCFPTNVGCSMTFFNVAASFDQMYKNGSTKAQDTLQLIFNHSEPKQFPQP
jgi:hypothetical protein